MLRQDANRIISKFNEYVNLRLESQLAQIKVNEMLGRACKFKDEFENMVLAQVDGNEILSPPEEF